MAYGLTAFVCYSSDFIGALSHAEGEAETEHGHGGRRLDPEQPLHLSDWTGSCIRGTYPETVAGLEVVQLCVGDAKDDGLQEQVRGVTMMQYDIDVNNFTCSEDPAKPQASQDDVGAEVLARSEDEEDEEEMCMSGLLSQTAL